MPEWMIIAGLLVTTVLMLVWILVNFYRKCPPNQAMIISGMMAGPAVSSRIVVGGGAVVLPLIQQVNYISLELFTIDVKATAPIVTTDGIPLFVSGTAQVKVKSDNTSIATAAEQMLGKTSDEISSIALHAISGSLRTAIARLSVSEALKQPDFIAMTVKELSNEELEKYGLTAVSFAITETRDEVGYIDAQARETVSLKQKQAQS